MLVPAGAGDPRGVPDRSNPAALELPEQMKLVVLDKQTSDNLYIQPEGATFGRFGGDAQIRIQDVEVSKRHARIYLRKGTWYLEDLSSANGTFLGHKRVTSPVKLSPGTVFSLSRQKFQVVEVLEDTRPKAKSPRLMETEISDKTPSAQKNGLPRARVIKEIAVPPAAETQSEMPAADPTPRKGNPAVRAVDDAAPPTSDSMPEVK